MKVYNGVAQLLLIYGPFYKKSDKLRALLSIKFCI